MCVQRRNRGKGSRMLIGVVEQLQLRRRCRLTYPTGRRSSGRITGTLGEERTLKGRDLSRVRNAIWEKTGFQD
uniref:Uncharacterized protein n=1 Tax=Nelumbo nucifera TaxID=4432 RepID=A0A822Y2J7_NELNU|nr:TPA_asm: hypothetical protein HUJ06_027651 [Nelumbo nucifera]